MKDRRRLAVQVLAVATVMTVNVGRTYAQCGNLVNLEICCGMPPVCTDYALMDFASDETGTWCEPCHVSIPGGGGCLSGSCTGNAETSYPLGHVSVRLWQGNNYGEFGIPPPATAGGLGATGPIPLGGVLPSGTSGIWIKCPFDGQWMYVGTITIC